MYSNQRRWRIVVCNTDSRLNYTTACGVPGSVPRGQYHDKDCVCGDSIGAYGVIQRAWRIHTKPYSRLVDLTTDQEYQ